MGCKQDYIAVFDSGVGGISVLRQLRKLMPNERYLYFGDSANAPYGVKSTGEIRNLTLNAAKMLKNEGIKALVVACNTATAAAIEDLRREFTDLIVIGIEPALKPAVKAFPKGCVGILATDVTLREEKFNKLLRSCAEECTAISLRAPGLVELVEQGKANFAETRALLEPILSPWAGKMDALVLGCTHYPFAAEVIRSILGEKTLLLDGGEGVARETQRRLAQENLLFDGPGEVKWLNSANNPKIEALSKELLEK